MQSDTPKPIHGPMSFFTEDQVSRRKADEDYIDFRIELGRKARMLRELHAFAQWEAYVSEMSSSLFYSIVENPYTGLAMKLRNANKKWQEWEPAEREKRLEPVLTDIAKIFDIPPPGFQTWEEYRQTPEYAPQSLSVMMAKYSPRYITISLVRPDLTSADFWIALTTLVHEFGHHLIYSKSLEIFDRLGEDLDRTKFAEDPDMDPSVILNMPLCSVISACAEFANDPQYMGEYNDKYFSPADGIAPSSEEFLEEGLVNLLETCVLEHIREAVLILDLGYDRPCSDAYARIVPHVARECHEGAVFLLQQNETPYRDEIIEEILELGKSKEAYLSYKEQLMDCVDALREQVKIIPMSHDHPHLQKWNALQNNLNFYYFCTGRFEAYNGAETSE